MINKTELMALEWLKKKGYKDNEIIKNSNTSPDFICQDGKRYEVKFLYGSRIIFYSTQTKNLKKEDIILVFDRTKFITEFLWKEREKISINIQMIEKNENLMIIQIEKETAKNLKKLKSTKLETYDEIIKRLIKNATKTTR